MRSFVVQSFLTVTGAQASSLAIFVFAAAGPANLPGNGTGAQASSLAIFVFAAAGPANLPGNRDGCAPVRLRTVIPPPVANNSLAGDRGRTARCCGLHESCRDSDPRQRARPDP